MEHRWRRSCSCWSKEDLLEVILIYCRHFCLFTNCSRLNMIPGCSFVVGTCLASSSLDWRKAFELLQPQRWLSPLQHLREEQQKLQQSQLIEPKLSRNRNFKHFRQLSMKISLHSHFISAMLENRIEETVSKFSKKVAFYTRKKSNSYFF